MLEYFHGQDCTDYTLWLVRHPDEFTVWRERKFRVAPAPTPDTWTEPIPGKSPDPAPYVIHRVSCPLIQVLADEYQAACGSLSELTEALENNLYECEHCIKASTA
jgi:hypothetical protein